MEIFDGHTHFFSREFYELQTRSITRGEAEIGLKDGFVKSPAAVAAYGDRVLDRMDESGVTRAVTYASIQQEAEIVGEAALYSDGRLIPYVMVNPVVDASFVKIQSLQPRYRFRGILLCPHVHEYNLVSQEAARALNFARKNRMVVFLHCGFLRPRIRALFGLDPSPPPDRVQFTELAHVARKRSKQIFVVGHIDLALLDGALGTLESCPNVYIETGGIFQLASLGDSAPDLALIFRKIKDVIGIERILYGSDSSGFPADYKEKILDVQIRAMTEAGYKNAEREAVLGGNLSRVLGFPGRGDR